jgi:type IV pilus assembly protein PilC
VLAQLRRQGLQKISVKKVSSRGGKKITEKDITIFTAPARGDDEGGRAAAAGLRHRGPRALQPRVGKLCSTSRPTSRPGSSLGQAFRKYPKYFDALFCNLWPRAKPPVSRQPARPLGDVQGKDPRHQGKIKSALFYPISIVVVALVVTAVIMIFVIPVFKDLFKSFGADLPGPTLVVMAISDWFIGNWWWLFPGIIGGVYGFFYAWKRSTTMQRIIDRLMLRLPVFGDVLRKASIARWCRTLSTMFAAGVPLVESLDSVAGAAGNYVYYDATKKIQAEVSSGTGLTISMGNTGVFPSMVLQMVAIGEESGALDAMLSKVADFYEQEVDEAVDSLSSLMEPMIMVVLGGLIGGIVVAMYLPIFKMGQAI